MDEEFLEEEEEERYPSPSPTVRVKPPSAAPPGTLPRRPLSEEEIKRIPKKLPDVQKSIAEIKAKYAKRTPMPTINSTNKVSTPDLDILPLKKQTQTPTNISPSEVIESFEMPSSSESRSMITTVVKYLLITILFYLLAHKKAINYTNKLEISDRVDSLIIHAIIFALLVYVIQRV
jgi:predicted secreted protein